MPSDPTAEHVELRRKGRQRLIGAVALVLVAVVFVPMVLDPEPRRGRVEPELAIPPKDSNAGPAKLPKAKSPGTPVTQAPTDPATALSAAAPPASVAAVEAPPSEAKKSVEAKSPEFKQAAPRPTAPAAKPAPSAPTLEGFAVQVGAFKDDAKLAQARERIAAARLAHYTERLDGSSGELTRLRAGPFPTREAAERAAVQLKRAGLEARVVTLP